VVLNRVDGSLDKVDLNFAHEFTDALRASGDSVRNRNLLRRHERIGLHRHVGTGLPGANRDPILTDEDLSQTVTRYEAQMARRKLENNR
jgi:hypothetical protein